MAVDFKKWNDQFGGKEAVDALNNAKSNERTEVPDGTYVCHMDKLELAETKDGRPMVSAMFRIMEGKHKKQCIFYNQVFTRGFPQHKALEFLRSMNVFDETEIDFSGDFEGFNDLLLDIAEEAEPMKFEVVKGHDGDYQRLEITDTFE